MQAAEYAEIEIGFGHWLAGLVDGEGCFSIKARRDQGTFICFFELRLRADDRPLLETCQQTVGLGRLYATPADGNDNPQVCWTVYRQRDCRRLVEIFDAFPLRSKKARDFVVLREAVATLATVRRGHKTIRTANQPAWDRLAILKKRLSGGRAYEPIALPDLPSLPPQETLWVV